MRLVCEYNISVFFQRFWSFGLQPGGSSDSLPLLRSVRSNSLGWVGLYCSALPSAYIGLDYFGILSISIDCVG